MSINARYIEDRLQRAALLEVRDSESHLFGDLYEAATTEGRGDGLSVNFGADRDAFGATLEVLGIEQQIEAGRAHVHNVVLNNGISTSFQGSAIPSVKEAGLLVALDAAHASGLSTYKESSLYSRLKPASEVMASWILVASSIKSPNDEGQVIADIEQPGITIGAAYRYLPEIEKEYGEASNLAPVLDEVKQMPGGERNTLGALARYLDYSWAELLMPRRDYHLRIGKLAAHHGPWGGLIDVEVDTSRQFQLQNGRLQRVHPEE